VRAGKALRGTDHADRGSSRVSNEGALPPALQRLVPPPSHRHGLAALCRTLPLPSYQCEGIHRRRRCARRCLCPPGVCRRPSLRVGAAAEQSGAEFETASEGLREYQKTSSRQPLQQDCDRAFARLRLRCRPGRLSEPHSPRRAFPASSPIDCCFETRHPVRRGDGHLRQSGTKLFFPLMSGGAPAIRPT